MSLLEENGGNPLNVDDKARKQGIMALETSQEIQNRGNTDLHIEDQTPWKQTKPDNIQ